MSKVVKKGTEVFIYSSGDQLIGYGGVSQDTPLSNFYKSQLNYCGHTFPNAECAIMWTKAQTFGDQKTANQLLHCSEAHVAKRLGRNVTPFDPKVWIDVRNEEVPKILYQKFTENPKLKEWLLSTGSAELAEIAIEDGNGRIRYKDPIWGITIGPSHPSIGCPKEWHKFGQNFLGKTLMKVRQTIESLNK